MKAALFENTSRRWVVREDMGCDLGQPELLEGVLAYPLDNAGHDATPPKWPGKPVTDLGPVRRADLESVEAAAAAQGVLGGTDGPLNRPALLLGDFRDQGDPFIGVGVRVRK